MTLSSTERENGTNNPPAVDSEWEQQYPESLRGIRVKVTAVKYEDGQVWVESEEVGFPGGRAWLGMSHWTDFYRQSD